MLASYVGVFVPRPAPAGGVAISVRTDTFGGGPADVEHNPVGAVFADPEKRALAARILGQAYVQAHTFVAHNRAAIERLADVVVERRELYGDELVELLESVGLELPEVDLTKEESWPVL